MLTTCCLCIGDAKDNSRSPFSPSTAFHSAVEDWNCHSWFTCRKLTLISQVGMPNTGSSLLFLRTGVSKCLRSSWCVLSLGSPFLGAMLLCNRGPCGEARGFSYHSCAFSASERKSPSGKKLRNCLYCTTVLCPVGASACEVAPQPSPGSSRTALHGEWSWSLWWFPKCWEGAFSVACSTAAFWVVLLRYVDYSCLLSVFPL